ncbi:hypothetical protein Runsl_3760 [Runella slithyformis DSM 19594]|uniref:Uncharacterized protein n=1 Tax=Runella slithyformis (strain ATCC 29530 / DSM 19594 / LMG 11500 / NCIMB 11436 / LSU 4) TaxID=761193 RepID=A0A7U4E6Y9_RUNSL|nr:hypothetical protein Runsl_3760 [Runella slithyformis DSM 19594]
MYNAKKYDFKKGSLIFNIHYKPTRAFLGTVVINSFR